MLDVIINPSKEINEQFVPTAITKTDGTHVIGTIVNLNRDTVKVNTDGSDPNQQESVDRNQVTSIEPSKISLMPPGLTEHSEQGGSARPARLYSEWRRSEKRGVREPITATRR